MKQNENAIQNFIERLNALNTLVVFIGNGASMEGTLLNDEPYPSFSRFIVDILTRAGKNIDNKINENNASDYMDLFAKYIEYEHDNASVYLRRYLDGMPSATHYHLINLLSCLYHIKGSEFSRLLFVTTNYDDFIEQTFENSNVTYYSISLSKNKSQIDKTFFDSIEKKLKDKIPIILHIFGDLKSEKPIIFQKNMEFHQFEKKFLLELFKSTILSIGYSFSDYNIKNLICLKDNDYKPIYNVSKSDCEVSAYSSEQRKIYNTKSRFNEFVIKVLDELYKRSNQNKTNKISTYKFENNVITEYENRIKTIPQKYSYDLKFLKWRTSLINNFSLNKILLKTSKGSVNIDELYVERNHIIDWRNYLKSDESIYLIQGNAGVGKSTFMYMTAKNQSDKIFKLLISPSSLESSSNLVSYLEKQFLCQPNQLEVLFEYFNDLLKVDNSYLIIFFDAINELGEIKARRIKTEIEDFFKIKWSHIKIVYSCRTYFWKNSLQGSHSNENYFNTEEIKYFSDEELEKAFQKYKKSFNLIGDFSDLTSDFKEKLKDPLMLRLLSEGYSNKGLDNDSPEIRKIPEFAPAVEIFTEYVNLLDTRYANDNIEKFLIKIGNLYWKNYNKVLGTMSMEFMIFDDLNKDTIQYLKDSNVIYEEDKCIQFSYERLFEFVLGLTLISKENWESHLQKITAQRVFEIWKESIDVNKPYTFNFALKSSLIYLSRKSKYNEKNLIKNPLLLNDLLHIKDTIKSESINDITAKEFSTFILEVLKELLSEGDSKEKGYEELKNNLGEEKFFNIVLEIGRDDIRTIEYQVELLVCGSDEQRRQIIINLLKLCTSKESITQLKKAIITSFHKKIDEESLIGLVYLVPVFINIHKIGIHPFEIINEIIVKLTANLNFPHNNKFRNNILKAIKSVYEEEGKYFFGIARGFNGIEYTWQMGSEEKNLANELVSEFSKPTIRNISDCTKECIRFFASELRYFKDIDTQYSTDVNIDRMRSWEYFVAKYVVMKLSEKDFNKALDLLDYLLKKNTWLTYDFVLTTMEFILRNTHIDNRENYDVGLLKMQEWVKLGEDNFNEFFFARLSSKDPLNISFNPLSHTANTMAEKNPKSSFKFLDPYIESNELKKAKMALLSLRKVSRRFPIAGKKSLVNAWIKKDNYDEEYRNWLNQFIKELSFVNPKMIYELLNDVNATDEERNKIMNIQITARTNEYNINMFFLWLLKDSNAMDKIVNLYYEMLDSSQDTFFNNKFFEWVKSHV